MHCLCLPACPFLTDTPRVSKDSFPKRYKSVPVTSVTAQSWLGVPGEWRSSWRNVWHPRLLHFQASISSSGRLRALPRNPQFTTRERERSGIRNSSSRKVNSAHGAQGPREHHKWPTQCRPPPRMEGRVQLQQRRAPPLEVARKK